MKITDIKTFLMHVGAPDLKAWTRAAGAATAAAYTLERWASSASRPTNGAVATAADSSETTR